MRNESTTDHANSNCHTRSFLRHDSLMHLRPAILPVSVATLPAFRLQCKSFAGIGSGHPLAERCRRSMIAETVPAAASPSGYRWQRTQCRAPRWDIPGIVCLHIAIAYGQRGSNGQPGGGSISDGISPSPALPGFATRRVDLAPRRAGALCRDARAGRSAPGFQPPQPSAPHTSRWSCRRCSVHWRCRA